MPLRSPEALLGRDDELAELHELVSAAHESRGGALVLRGGPGIGKTALLDRLVATRAAGCRVIRVAGSEFEADLPFAALHQLCAGLLARLPEVSPPCAEALSVAFGLGFGTPAALRVGLGALELWSLAAREQPLLCVIDDAQWLDDASVRALTFVARRLEVEPIAMVVAARDDVGSPALAELPTSVVDALPERAADALLSSRLLGTLDDQVRSRLLAEARGNPLALIELPRAGGFVPPGRSSVGDRIAQGFGARIAELTDDPRRLLLLAGVDPTGDPELLWSAARHEGVDLASAGAAVESSGLLEVGARVRFCHPLARAAACHGATAPELRSAHRTLASVTGADDPDRRAWHRGQAAAGPDAEVATELADTAERATARGGAAAASAFLSRAAALSADPATRLDRTLAAAAAAVDAGDPATGSALLAGIDVAGLDTGRAASLELLRGRIALADPDGGARIGPELILSAARRLRSVDPRRSRRCYVDAVECGMLAGRAAGVLDRALEAARDAPVDPGGPDLLTALIALAGEGYAAGIPLLRAALAGESGWTRVPALATVLAGELWDLELHAEVTQWATRTGTRLGSPALLRLGLSQRALAAVLTGDLSAATATIAEEEALADAVGDRPHSYPLVYLAGLRGRRTEALELFARLRGEDDGRLVGNVDVASAILHNGLGDYPTAVEEAGRAVTGGDLYVVGVALPELVEAAVRSGEPDTARWAFEALQQRTVPAATTYADGVTAGARALLSEDEDDHRAALEHLAASPAAPAYARAELRYGEWLRRRGRRRDARSHLLRAHEQLRAIGMDAFARRAADELAATGETVHLDAEPTHDRLTPRELHIARHVAAGATSKEIASTLFLSPRTVDAHLRNIFRKLGVTSRRELRDLPELGSRQDEAH